MIVSKSDGCLYLGESGVMVDHFSFCLTPCAIDVGIPVKVNIDSGGKPNGIPERR